MCIPSLISHVLGPHWLHVIGMPQLRTKLQETPFYIVTSSVSSDTLMASPKTLAKKTAFHEASQTAKNEITDFYY